VARSAAIIAEALGHPWLPPFRGEIYEYARALNLQQGYAVKGPFDIATARHLIEPLQAIRDPAVRLVSIQGAVQCLKSLIADITIPYWLQHDPGDVLWLFEDDPKARIYAETRAMPLIRGIPAIYRMLEDVERHSKTKTKIKFSHCNLVICGLNEGNVQSISYRYIVIDEAWMARANGLIRQAKDRAKQYHDTRKIILIGQGGWEDEDFDLEHKQTDMRELTYACPFCGFRQPFELSRLRPEDFHVERLRGTYAGLSWDTNEKTKPAGRWNFDAVGRSAHHRCYQCDGRIEDRPEVRRQLNDSYAYQVTNPGAPAGQVGFHWPAEASMRIPFAELVVKYLRAKTASEELAYRLPLQEFYQKDRGLTWSESVAAEYRITVHEPYDVKSDWPEEAHRVLVVDCQRDLKKFWYSVFALALSGEVRELARGGADSFEAVAEVQHEWKLKDQHCYFDCGYEMTKVLRECVKHGHVGSIKVGAGVRKIWLCWTGLKGSGHKIEIFKHKHPRTELSEWRIYSERKFYDVNIGTNQRGPRAPWYEWSNLHCKDLLRARRDAEPGLPKFRTLPDTLPGTDPWSYFAQMRSEKRIEAYEGGKKRSIWKPIKETRPNHYWDVGAMLMAVLAIYGIIGAPEKPVEE
jgi:hypothetical protein